MARKKKKDRKRPKRGGEPAPGQERAAETPMEGPEEAPPVEATADEEPTATAEGEEDESEYSGDDGDKDDQDDELKE